MWSLGKWLGKHLTHIQYFNYLDKLWLRMIKSLLLWFQGPAQSFELIPGQFFRGSVSHSFPITGGGTEEIPVMTADHIASELVQLNCLWLLQSCVRSWEH